MKNWGLERSANSEHVTVTVSKTTNYDYLDPPTDMNINTIQMLSEQKIGMTVEGSTPPRTRAPNRKSCGVVFFFARREWVKQTSNTEEGLRLQTVHQAPVSTKCTVSVQEKTLALGEHTAAHRLGVYVCNFHTVQKRLSNMHVHTNTDKGDNVNMWGTRLKGPGFLTLLLSKKL